MTHQLTKLIRQHQWASIYVILCFLAIFTVSGLLPIKPLWDGILTLSLISWAYLYGIIYLIRRLLPDELKGLLIKSIHAKYLIWGIIGIFVVTFSLRERTVYFWDSSGYWTGSYLYLEQWMLDVGSSLKQLYTSILNSDYTLVPVILLLLPLKLIGISFPAFTLSVYLMYVVPFFAITVALVIRIAYDAGIRLSLTVIILCFAFIAFITPILKPVLFGYLDALGLTICISILAITYMLEKQQIKRSTAYIELILLLVVLVFTRRWFAFWIEAFFISYMIISIVQLFSHSREQRVKVLKSILGITLVGIGFVVILFIGFKPFLIRSAFTNYGDIYSAYQTGSFLHNIKIIVQHISMWSFILATIGFIGILMKSSYQWFICMIILQSIFSLSLFIHVQSMSPQHYYLVIPALAIFVLFGIITLSNLTKKRFVNVGILLIASMITIGGFSHAFIKEPIPILENFSSIYTSEPFYPRLRNDFGELRSIVSYLNDLSDGKKSEHKKYVYTLASSVVLNDDILRKVNLPYELYSVPQLVAENHVDKVDGFPKQLLESEVVVVGDPIQYHLLDTSGQRVVGVLAEQFLKHEGIGKSFRLDKTFTLDENVKVKVYIRAQPLKNEDLKALQTQFQAWYPEFADKFKIVD